MNELENPVVLKFPLRGEWMAPNTPGKKIPSHGTDQLGQRYAYDFMQVDWEKKGMIFYKTSKLRYLIFGVPLKKCYCWGKKVYAPCDGKIVVAKDGYNERRIVHLLSDMFVVLKNAFTFNPEKTGFQPAFGNYIVMECEDGVYAFFAHLQKKSITVSEGDTIKKGQVIARVGHSGNSTAPHLHFHLMDSINFMKAEGIPCVFDEYELYQKGNWETVRNGVPTDRDRIRH
ncbi:MAG: M23 family metallopeptidase [bacterium]